MCRKRFLSKEKTDNQPTKIQRTRTNQVDKIKFNPSCIFCNKTTKKKVKMFGHWSCESLSYFRSNDCKKVLQKAEEKNDERLMIRIRSYDLKACSAKFHRSCRRSYMGDSNRWKSSNQDSCEKQADLECAHAEAFEEVSLIIQDEVIDKKKVMKLSDLRDKYVDALRSNQHSNQQYRSEKLKKKI